MLMNRIWAMPNSLTFTIKPIKELLERYVKNDLFNSPLKWIDCFANESKIATITNDLNPNYKTDYHLDALDFLKLFEDNSVDGVLYDPPYSLRQVSECYKGVGVAVTQETTQSSWRSRHLDEIKRILKPEGIVVCFGWNSMGVGKTRGFEMLEVLLVPHGGSKNDTIVTVEKKSV
jgi:tRNA G10  N-methylase Trm11